MTEALLKKYKQKLEKLILVPSDGGKFEVSLDGKLIFSKIKEKRFPKVEEICAKIPA